MRKVEMILLNSFNLLMFISILNTQKINSYDSINIYGMIFFSICFYILIFIDKIVNVNYYIGTSGFMTSKKKWTDLNTMNCIEINATQSAALKEKNNDNLAA